MVTHAIATAISQPVLISTVSQRGAVSPTFTDITRINYNQLPAGASGYSVLAFGHVGRFFSTGGAPGDKFVLVGLRFLNGGGLIQQSITRIPLTVSMFQDASTGAARNQAQPWGVMLNLPLGSWPANTALAISATIEQVSAPSGPAGSFWCDVSTIVVFSHSSLGAVYANDATQTPLPYSNVGYHVLADSTTLMPTTGDYVALYSAQVTPSTKRPTDPYPVGAYYHWLTKMVSGVDDTTFGATGFAQVLGCVARDGYDIGVDPLYHLYSLCGWYPFTVTSTGTTKLQLRGWSADNSSTGRRRAESTYGGICIVPKSAFTDVIAEAIEVIPGLINRDPWTTAQNRVVEIGDDRPQHFTLAMTTLSDQVVASNTSSLTLLDVGGFPQQRFPVNALQSRIYDAAVDRMPNYASQLLTASPFQAEWPELPVVTRGVVNPYSSPTADSGGSFALFSFTPTDAGDRPPITQRTITYVPITFDSEIDGTTLLQLTTDEHPSESQSINRETGLVTFTTDDGHTIRWPTWSKSRRAWRVSWTCDQGRYQILYTKLYRPESTLFIRMPSDWPEAPSAVVKVDQLSAEQVGSNMVWRISATLVEAVHTV